MKRVLLSLLVVLRPGLSAYIELEGMSTSEVSLTKALQ